jgi:hypothetical protein
LSGSTFLATGEALVSAGVAAQDITFLTSHAPAPESLRARDAARRWSRFTTCAGSGFVPPADSLDLSGGAWRSLVFGSAAPWPASWPAQERVKYLTADRRFVVKFAGFPPYRDLALARAEELARLGWGPPVMPVGSGFVAYRWIQGRPAAPSTDRSRAPATIARYLAVRSTSAWHSVSESDGLLTMTRTNVLEETGIDLPAAFELPVHSVVHTDARLMPHEWVVVDHRMLKTDAVDHGDDHFFPGPTDVAFDLAGAIVEWNFDEGQSAQLLSEYWKLTGDEAGKRLTPYVVAYCASRIGVCSFAEGGCSGEEASRWRRARTLYRIRLYRALDKLGLHRPDKGRHARGARNVRV